MFYVSGKIKKSSTSDQDLKLGNDGVVTPDVVMLQGQGKVLVIFNDVPTRSHLLEHDADVGDAQPIRQHFYRVSEENSS